jgi:hypothetical protein
VAKSKKKKRQQAQARSKHRAQVERKRKETRHEHLPKVGTPADDAYRLKRSREDLVNFGMSPARKGAVNWVIVVAIIVLLIGGAIGLIILSGP